ncbi:DgyrCDS3829 [Dimorphilus gyrociliatus]|uniref:DgyrCDS3829 n=1 Tax=Dimorphilus gyrociliatus TaxID=2664684 RepID=A0A7I8VF23_9ANNE|nr:DgyrCDS3829 [Dimorphilus gyrociliatus]
MNVGRALTDANMAVDQAITRVTSYYANLAEWVTSNYRKCERCSSNCRYSCNEITGYCYGNKCRSGWTGPRCLEKCRTGTYGIDCNRTCISHHCKGGNTSCHHVTGECINGCSFKNLNVPYCRCDQYCFNDGLKCNCEGFLSPKLLSIVLVAAIAINITFTVIFSVTLAVLRVVHWGAMKKLERERMLMLLDKPKGTFGSPVSSTLSLSETNPKCYIDPTGQPTKDRLVDKSTDWCKLGRNGKLQIDFVQVRSIFYIDTKESEEEISESRKKSTISMTLTDDKRYSNALLTQKTERIKIGLRDQKQSNTLVANVLNSHKITATRSSFQDNIEEGFVLVNKPENIDLTKVPGKGILKVFESFQLQNEPSSYEDESEDFFMREYSALDVNRPCT